MPFKLGLGGRLGNGRQWMSWIHVDDVVELVLHAARREEITGPINAVSTRAPVTNRDFARRTRRRAAPAGRISRTGRGAEACSGRVRRGAAGSQRVVPQVAKHSGYQFRYAELTAALEAILRGAWSLRGWEEQAEDRVGLRSLDRKNDRRGVDRELVGLRLPRALFEYNGGTPALRRCLALAARPGGLSWTP